jgi:hypothetical protein
MPKILVTIDHLDGATKVYGPFYPDEIPLTGLLFKLSERSIAGVTFTNAQPLRALMKGMQNGDGSKVPDGGIDRRDPTSASPAGTGIARIGRAARTAD